MSTTLTDHSNFRPLVCVRAVREVYSRSNVPCTRGCIIYTCRLCSPRARTRGQAELEFWAICSARAVKGFLAVAYATGDDLCIFECRGGTLLGKGNQREAPAPPAGEIEGRHFRGMKIGEGTFALPFLCYSYPK